MTARIAKVISIITVVILFDLICERRFRHGQTA